MFFIALHKRILILIFLFYAFKINCLKKYNKNNYNKIMNQDLQLKVNEWLEWDKVYTNIYICFDF